MGWLAGLAGTGLGCARPDKWPAAGMATHTAPLNIVWLVAEDMCPDLGCYGQPLVTTPNLDRLAADGVRFERAFANAPVCSPSRSALITGMDPISIDAQHHRSHRDDGYRLPDGVRLVTDCLRDAGYFTSNGSVGPDGRLIQGKTDFNFTATRPFDGRDWRERRPGQPFFAMVNFFEAHRGFPWDQARHNPHRVDPARVTQPAYYPDDPVVRDDIATYLTTISQLDEKVGLILRRLEADGVLDRTAIFFFADHGQCLIRGKQWLYDAGLHVPLIIQAPGRIPAGAVRGDLVSLIDVTATTLELAGATPPRRLAGHPLFDPEFHPRTAIFASRDRCDETRDRVRAVRDKKYKYIRNYFPDRPYTQPNAYIDGSYPVLGVLKREQAKGTLTPAQAFFMQPVKPPEELYDITRDPDEVRNLAQRPEYRKVLKNMRHALDRWLRETGDTGAREEAPTAESQ